MAQQVVFTVLERGGTIAVDEAKYLLGISDKLESAKNQLKNMQAFLKDMDDRTLRTGTMARNLVSDVREVAYEVEDIIDTANILTRQSDPNTSIKGAICKHACFPIYLMHLHKLGERIDLANAMMKTIFEDFKRYNIASSVITEEPHEYITENDTIKHWRSVHPDMGDEVDVIGFDDQIKQIQDDLLDTRSRHLSIISVVGPGGAGKSTMAKKVYGSAVVKGQFEVHAWITVPQKVVARDLLREMVNRTVPHHLLEEVIKRTIVDERAKSAKEVKEVKELEKFVPSHLLEEVIEHMESKKANEANEPRFITHHPLEEINKHTAVDEKAMDAEVIEAKELEKFVPLRLLEQVIKLMENNKAKEANGLRFVPRYILEDVVKCAIEGWKAKEPEKESKEVRYLLDQLIKCIMDDVNAREVKMAQKVELEELKEEQLTKLLHKFALNKRYLIVLDDIWSTDAWDIIRAAFPDKKNGSRIVLTTRNEAVAQHPYAWKKIYKPKLLNEEESTQLLLNTALPEHIFDGRSVSPATVGQNMDELKELGKDLALKCCGLPLAIVVLGGHLSRYIDVAEWKRLTSSMDWRAMIAADRIIGAILDLSYYDMPSHLRSCFLYTTAFPEDSHIDVRVLAMLWVAEGFIPQVRGQTREEEAIKYVAELVQRCMIQVVERRSGRITMIKVHDILRDWGIGRARREGLMKDCHAVEDIEVAYSEETMKPYRVVLHGSLAREVSASTRKLRTVLDFTLCFNNPRVKVAKSFQGLRVLYLHCSGVVYLPSEIGRMRYLRYLGLGGAATYHVPSCIGDLLSLETMDATEGKISHIPGSLWKITTLRRVRVSCAGSWSVPRVSSQSKAHLMALSSVKGNADDILEAKQVMKATKEQLSEDKNPDLSYCFGMTYMNEQVHIMGRCTGENQFLNYLPDFEKMPGIGMVKICCSNLLSNDQKMVELGRLWFLKFLEIGEQSYTGLVLTCSSDSFPNLEWLVFHDLEVKDWKFERGSMRSLRRLTLCKCSNLNYLPEGLALLPGLVKLDLIAMPEGCQQGTVAQELGKKGSTVYISSSEKDFKHLEVPFPGTITGVRLVKVPQH